MLTYALMGLLVIALAFTTLWGAKYDPDKSSFMSIEDTTFLRGFWCIIVVLVHVPEAYQNRIQDMLGSFAYIGVTFFFMTSAYGLKWSMGHKPDYMDYFWRRRLPPILIPALIANAFQVLAYGLNGEEITFLSFIDIDAWVKVLLLYYFIFWIIYGILPQMTKGGYWQDVLMCLMVVACSLIDYFTEFKITSRWIVEPLGFAYGIIAAFHAEKIKSIMKGRWLIKSISLMLVSGILGIAYLKFKPVVIWGDYVLKIFLGIAITVFIFQAISNLRVGNKMNGFLGGISYEVYILHHGIFALLIAATDRKLNSGVFIVGTIFLTVFAAFLLKKICKPMISGINKIGG